MLSTCKVFLENLPWPAWMEDMEHRLIFINKHYEKLHHIKYDEVIGKKSSEVFSEIFSRWRDEHIEKCKQTLDVHMVEASVKGRFSRCYIFPMLDEDKKIQVVVGVNIDINDMVEREMETRKQKEILRTIIDAVPESIFYKDKESRYIGYNKRFQEFYEARGVNEIKGKTDLEIYDDQNVAKQFVAQDQEIIESGKAKYYEHTIIDEAGRSVVEENVKIPVIDDNGEVWGVVGLSRDITERKQMEERLRYLSEIDRLTGVYNRYSFEEKVREFNDAKYLPLGIIMGDVNGLKIVNDTLGHLEGDCLLTSIAGVLQKVCGGAGFVFRWGGDEFMILLPNHTEAQCEKLIGAIREACEQSVYEFMQLSIALGETVRMDLEQDVYECIKKVEEKVYRQKLLEKKSVNSSIMDSLQKSLEEKNMETNEHTGRVVKYALALGRKLDFKISELDELTLVARLHDIGKIGINEDVLLKPGRLTEEEFEIMKGHPEKGYRIINASSELFNIAQCVLSHHEKWNGKGYPMGLKGEDIPLMARIINIADSFDVMTHDRVYKKAMTKEAAIEEMKRCSGEQFDPHLVDVFINYLKEEESI